MRAIHAILILSFLGCQNLPAQNTDIRKTVDTILLNFDQFQDISSISDKQRKRFKTYLFDLRNLEAQERKISGEISFGLNGLEVENNNLFVINTGFNLASGVYPFEFNLNSNIQAQTQNGVLKETVSKVGISFDYNFSEKDLGKETYVFVNRTNNSFLGIDQRYEIGGGLILNLYSGKSASIENQFQGLTDTGKEEIKKVEGFEKELPFLTEDYFESCVDSICSRIKNIPKKDRKNLKKSRNRFNQVIKKKYSTTRISILGGMNYELEKTADSLKLFFNEEERKGVFDATNRFRMVARPGFEWRGDNFSFTSNAYFKLGLFGELSNVIEEGLLRDEKSDYWVEWVSKLSFKFTKKIGLDILYTFFYDNAPNRKFFNIADATETPDFKIFEAEKRFTAISFKFKYVL